MRWISAVSMVGRRYAASSATWITSAVIGFRIDGVAAETFRLNWSKYSRNPLTLREAL